MDELDAASFPIYPIAKAIKVDVKVSHILSHRYRNASQFRTRLVGSFTNPNITCTLTTTIY